MNKNTLIVITSKNLDLYEIAVEYGNKHFIYKDIPGPLVNQIVKDLLK